MEIKNIFCIGRNYPLHAKELNNAVPSEPLIFSKPTHALAEANDHEMVLPKGCGEIHHELEFVVHISRSYEPGLTTDDLIDQIALGIDFTLRDVQSQLKEKGYPWLLAKGFPNSAVLTPWLPFEGLEAFGSSDFTLEKNGREVQRGNIKDMYFTVPSLLEYIAKHFGLGKGDILFTGTPAGVGPVAEGDCLLMKWNQEIMGQFRVTLK
ncbi:fumarylacetoacetate hydrolase family protein [Desulfosporosinus sp. FKB]|uniref:fumarylacetoacetate hydrolase family protein n=1 Tax=Desulfosporosinus sp. FKB TaxID=1969835 RepID=UPI000B49A4E3|nr:fumarylacetoacetate hydrolase family protein [Desulfosporosinus sp. FKB]